MGTIEIKEIFQILLYFQEKKGCFYGNRTIFACKFYLLYICRYIEPSSQIENTKACIAEKVLRSMGGFFIGLVTRGSRRRGSLSIHLLSYLLFHPLKLLVLFLFFKFQYSMSHSHLEVELCEMAEVFTLLTV